MIKPQTELVFTNVKTLKSFIWCDITNMPHPWAQLPLLMGRSQFELQVSSVYGVQVSKATAVFFQSPISLTYFRWSNDLESDHDERSPFPVAKFWLRSLAQQHKPHKRSWNSSSVQAPGQGTHHTAQGYSHLNSCSQKIAKLGSNPKMMQIFTAR